MTLASESLSLSGLKVLSVEFYGAGPFCTQYLSTFGADVIKIENSTNINQDLYKSHPQLSWSVYFPLLNLLKY